MTTLREAAQQALEALMDAQRHNYALKHKETDDLITALRAALAEPQVKPLTEEQIKACEQQAMVNGALPFEQRVFFARAIERAHGIGTEARATLTKPCGSLGEDVSLCRYPDCVGGQAGTICHNWCPGCR